MKHIAKMILLLTMITFFQTNAYALIDSSRLYSQEINFVDASGDKLQLTTMPVISCETCKVSKIDSRKHSFYISFSAPADGQRKGKIILGYVLRYNLEDACDYSLSIPFVIDKHGNFKTNDELYSFNLTESHSEICQYARPEMKVSSDRSEVIYLIYKV